MRIAAEREVGADEARALGFVPADELGLRGYLYARPS